MDTMEIKGNMVNGRSLHTLMESTIEYTVWMRHAISRFFLAEHQDYTVTSESHGIGRNALVYHLTLAAGRRICLMDNTPAPVTLSIEKALLRYEGVNAQFLRTACITKKLKAKKIANIWHIPIAELDLMFLGIRPAKR
jgi:phage anti-repressor protein